MANCLTSSQSLLSAASIEARLLQARPNQTGTNADSEIEHLEFCVAPGFSPRNQVRDQGHTQGLIDKLGDDSFDSREEASTELKAKGPRAFSALINGLNNKDPEIADRCKRALDELFKTEKVDFKIRDSNFTHGLNYVNSPSMDLLKDRKVRDKVLERLNDLDMSILPADLKLRMDRHLAGLTEFTPEQFRQLPKPQQYLLNLYALGESAKLHKHLGFESTFSVDRPPTADQMPEWSLKMLSRALAVEKSVAQSPLFIKEANLAMNAAVRLLATETEPTRVDILKDSLKHFNATMTLTGTSDSLNAAMALADREHALLGTPAAQQAMEDVRADLAAGKDLAALANFRTNILKPVGGDAYRSPAVLHMVSKLTPKQMETLAEAIPAANRQAFLRQARLVAVGRQVPSLPRID